MTDLLDLELESYGYGSSNYLELWEILVPTMRSDGRAYNTRYHRVWDAEIRSLAGGLSIAQPINGQWVDTLDENEAVYKERMIPVRIAMTPDRVPEVLEATKKHYHDQLQIFMCKLGDVVISKNEHYKDYN